MAESGEMEELDEYLPDGVEIENFRKRRVVEIMGSTDDPVLTTSEIAEGLDVGERATHNHLAELEEMGVVKRKKASRASIWWLPDHSSEADREEDDIEVRTPWERKVAEQKERNEALANTVRGWLGEVFALGLIAFTLDSFVTLPAILPYQLFLKLVKTIAIIIFLTYIIATVFAGIQAFLLRTRIIANADRIYRDVNPWASDPASEETT